MDKAAILEKIPQLPLVIFTEHTVKGPTCISFKYEDPVSPEHLDIKFVRNFPMLDLYTLTSLNLIFGYLFLVDKKIVGVYDKYFTVKRPSVRNLPQFSNVSMDYQSNYINIISSPDGAALVMQNKLEEVIKQEMIRKSKRSGRER